MATACPDCCTGSMPDGFPVNSSTNSLPGGSAFLGTGVILTWPGGTVSPCTRAGAMTTADNRYREVFLLTCVNGKLHLDVRLYEWIGGVWVQIAFDDGDGPAGPTDCTKLAPLSGILDAPAGGNVVWSLQGPDYKAGGQ